MTLKTRVIPILQWDGVQAVKTKQFARPPRNVGSMMQHIQNMNRREVDELIIQDINAGLEGREPLYEKIQEFTNECYMPVTICGGISNLFHIERLLKAGADKVGIGYRAFDFPFICDAVKKFGSQAIVVSINELNGVCYQFQKDIWQELAYPASMLIQTYSTYGVGEILLNSMSRDGVKTGYDLAIYENLNVTTPIIANGGCGEPRHMLEAIQAGAHAVAASSMFLFSDVTPKDCSRYLAENGVPTRV